MGLYSNFTIHLFVLRMISNESGTSTACFPKIFILGPGMRKHWKLWSFLPKLKECSTHAEMRFYGLIHSRQIQSSMNGVHGTLTHRDSAPFYHFFPIKLIFSPVYWRGITNSSDSKLIQTFSNNWLLKDSYRTMSFPHWVHILTEISCRWFSLHAVGVTQLPKYIVDQWSL